MQLTTALIHSVNYHKERERRSRPKEERCLMFNLVVEKGASKDRNQSRLSITWLRMGIPTYVVDDNMQSEHAICDN